MEPRNLVQLIREVKPRTVLFTTYTLSLSFFEAMLLPLLRQVGCQNTAVLVDAQEAVKSLAEANVNYAGRRYWVAPVVAPGGGVFHPKLTYLSGDKVDVLAIGSGNLTMPGLSGQLETLDAVASTEDPSVFIQFQAFAAGLAAKIDSTSRQAADLLREYAIRAQDVAAKSGEAIKSFPWSPVLVSSLDRPARDQIIEYWRLQGEQATSLTVLSPFHAPDGGPLDRLASSLGASGVSVGLDPKTRVALFDLDRLKISGTTKYVVPVVDGSPRRLHGKVFEIAGTTGALVTTGSINATHQSLESTKNIEVSLARWLPSNCFKWSKTEPIRFEPNRYVFEDDPCGFVFIDASLDSLGWVRGRLYSSGSYPEDALAQILRSDEPLSEQDHEIKISESGEFSFGPIGDLAIDGAVQLIISATGLRATCWLNVIEELVSSDKLRHERQSVRHILRGEFKSEDVVALLQILLRVTSSGNTPPSKPDRVPDKLPPNKVSDPGDRPFSYLQWQMSGRMGDQQGALGFRHSDTLRAFIRWINGGASKSPVNGIDHKEVQPSKTVSGFTDLDLVQEHDTYAETEELLRQLIGAIPRLLAQHPDTDSADILVCVAGANALRQMLISTWTDERQLQPCVAWLDSYSRYGYRDSVRQTLQPIALGMAMVIAANAKHHHLTIPGSLIKDSLVRFGLGEKTVEELQPLVKQALSDELFGKIDSCLRGLAPEMCEEVWRAESIDDRILRIVAASRRRGSAKPDDEVIFPGVLARLRASFPKAGKFFQDGVLTSEERLGENSGCPHCYQRFDPAIRRALRARHAAVCDKPMCRKVIFFLEDPLVAEKVKKELRGV